MLKIAGAALVVISAGSLGILSARGLSERTRALAAFSRAIETMRSEICSRLTPLPEVMEKLAVCSEEPAGAFFTLCALKCREKRGRPFSEAWNAALDGADWPLQEKEKAVLREVGAVAGRYDADRQDAEIASARRRLESILESAEKEKERESRSRAAIGIAAGMALAIIFM